MESCVSVRNSLEGLYGKDSEYEKYLYICLKIIVVIGVCETQCHNVRK